MLLVALMLYWLSFVIIFALGGLTAFSSSFKPASRWVCCSSLFLSRCTAVSEAKLAVAVPFFEAFSGSSLLSLSHEILDYLQHSNSKWFEESRVFCKKLAFDALPG